MAELTPKERMKIKRHHMTEQPPMERVRNFSEVNLGYVVEIAQEEAKSRVRGGRIVV